MSFARRLYNSASESISDMYDRAERSRLGQRLANIRNKFDKGLKKLGESKIARFTAILVAAGLGYKGSFELLNLVLTPLLSVDGVGLGITVFSIGFGVITLAMAKNHIEQQITVMNRYGAETIANKKDIVDLYNDSEKRKLFEKQVIEYLHKVKYFQLELTKAINISENPELIMQLVSLQKQISENVIDANAQPNIFWNNKTLNANQTGRFFSLIETYAQFMAENLHLSPNLTIRILNDLQLVREELFPKTEEKRDSTQMINLNLSQNNNTRQTASSINSNWDEKSPSNLTKLLNTTDEEYCIEVPQPKMSDGCSLSPRP